MFRPEGNYGGEQTSAQLFDWIASQNFGEPIGCLIAEFAASRGAFQFATILWIVNPQRFYIISHKTNSFSVHNEFDSCVEEWCDLEKPRAQHFENLFQQKITDDLHSPYGGTAKFLTENRSEFGNIGWQEWGCEFRGASTFYREYKSGVAIGILPPFPNAESKFRGQILLPYNNGSVEIPTTELQGPECNNVFLQR